MGLGLGTLKKAIGRGTIEDRVSTEKAIDTYTYNLAMRVIKDDIRANKTILAHLAHNQYIKDRVGDVITSPAQAYAAEAMRRKAAELAPGFLERYRQAESNRNPAERIGSKYADSFLINLITTLAVGEVVDRLVYSAPHNLLASEATYVITLSAVFYVGRLVGKLSKRNMLNEVDTFRGQVRGAFYETLKK